MVILSAMTAAPNVDRQGRAPLRRPCLHDVCRVVAPDAAQCLRCYAIVGLPDFGAWLYEARQHVHGARAN